MGLLHTVISVRTGTEHGSTLRSAGGPTWRVVNSVVCSQQRRLQSITNHDQREGGIAQHWQFMDTGYTRACMASTLKKNSSSTPLEILVTQALVQTPEPKFSPSGPLWTVPEFLQNGNHMQVGKGPQGRFRTNRAHPISSAAGETGSSLTGGCRRACDGEEAGHFGSWEDSFWCRVPVFVSEDGQRGLHLPKLSSK